MAKEIIVPHDKLRNPNTITDVNKKIFAENGLDFHHNETLKWEDDNKKGVRVMKIKNSKTFAVGDVPWLKKKSN